MATPLVEWSFDEASGVAVDHSGNGRDLTLNGNAVRVAGHTGNGLSQSSAGITTGPDVNAFETPVRTWMLWLKVVGSANCWAMEFYRSADGTGVMGLLLLSGSLNFRVKNPSNTVFASANIPQDPGVWHHIAATYDATNTLRLYRDGALLGSPITVTGGLWDADVLRMLDSSGSVFTIDDVRLYGAALTQTEIQTAMNMPVGQGPDVGTLAGSFSSPAASIAAASTAGGALSGSFSSPDVAVAASSAAAGVLAGSFSAPTADLTGESIPPDSGALTGQFSQPIADMQGVYTATGLLGGTFSSPVFAALGGQPVSARDILFTITAGASSAYSIEVDATARTSISEGPQRTSIGVGNMDKQWRNGSKQFIDFTVGMHDPEGLLTLSEVEATPFQVAVTTTPSTPARDDVAWIDPSVPIAATAESAGGFSVLIKHMYTATEKGTHNVWVKFGPTPEEPIYLATSFVVL